MYFVEYTDTFGGEANYSWVRRDKVDAPNARIALRRARKLIGMTGCRGDITFDQGDEIWWVARGCCTVLMVRWSDDPNEVGEDSADD